MEKIYVVIIPVDYHNSRKICEFLENQTFNSMEEFSEKIKEYGIKGEYGDVLMYGLSDFMDGVNNQELDVLTDSFITYVKIKVDFK
jgi:hypothetical protein